MRSDCSARKRVLSASNYVPDSSFHMIDDLLQSCSITNICNRSDVSNNRSLDTVTNAHLHHRRREIKSAIQFFPSSRDFDASLHVKANGSQYVAASLCPKPSLLLLDLES